MRAKGFHHAALQVRDVARVAAFYRDVLGLPEVARHRRPDGSLRSVWLSVSADDAPDAGFLAVEAAEAPPEGAPGWSLLALRIDRADRADLVVQLQERGAEVVKETRWTVYVRDPEGNLVGLSHHPADPLPAATLPPA